MSDPSTMTGADVYDGNGKSVGKIDAIYFDNETDKPEWAAVRTGLFGGHVSLVPLGRSSWDGSALTVPFDKEALTAAPHHDPGTALSAADEQDLYRHYGMSTGQSAAEEPGGQGRDVSGPTTDDAMTRSEERMHVGTEQHESGRARLRKYIVSENVSTTVPGLRDKNKS
jgi:sporulation protein YlmC with PRC-barrel domain